MLIESQEYLKFDQISAKSSTKNGMRKRQKRVDYKLSSAIYLQQKLEVNFFQNLSLPSLIIKIKGINFLQSKPINMKNKTLKKTE